jgi:hypothetical protein
MLAALLLLAGLSLPTLLLARLVLATLLRVVGILLAVLRIVLLVRHRMFSVLRGNCV